MADSTISALSAASAVIGANEFVINEAGVSKKVSATQIKTFISTGGTVTANAPVIDATQTWNNAGVTFTAVKANITNTASAAASLLLDLQVGNASQFTVRKDGWINGAALTKMFSGQTVSCLSYLFTAGIFGVGDTGITAVDFLIEIASQNVVVMNAGTAFGWSSSGLGSANANTLRTNKDLTLKRVGASILGLSNVATAVGAALELQEMTAPSAGATNSVRLFAQDNGSGKTQLMVQFATGTAIQVAIEA